MLTPGGRRVVVKARSMACPACGETNRPERLYCARCGARLAAPCPACAAPSEPGEEFCGQCGLALAGGRPAVAPAPAMPATIAGGRYQLRCLLGEGGKKRVYLATDTRLDRDVAIALIKTEGLDEAGLARVRREARAMGKLGDHPHIVTVFDIGEEAGQPYIVSQHMPGGSVDDLLQAADRHRLPIQQTLRIADEVCRALQHAHDCGVVHRDVKPSNVWLTRDGTAKLGDFGLAVALDRSRLTVEGIMVGTVAYMPPEQALGRAPDARSDLYSLGAMLYEMVAGRPPFLGDDALAIVSQHLNNAPVAPSWHNPEVPKALEALILRLLAKALEHRPPSAAAVREALAAVATAPAGAEPAAREANPLDRLAAGVFVGRGREIEELRAAVEDVGGGRGRVVLLVGEPGIGKTRMASEIATYARMRGCQVLWGRAVESGGAPAYWPWVQVIRAYMHERDPQNAIAEMASGAADIARVVSEVRERLHDLPAPPALEPEQARFRLFDSVTTFLKNAANLRPLVLVLDDLHWADKPSLLLLQFLAREMESSRLLVVGTYRDVELGREHPLFQALGALAREAVTHRIALRGLSEEDIARYIEMTAGVTPPPALVAGVYRETEGNPFFLGEVVRLLVSEGSLIGVCERADWKFSVPQGVREVISRRLDVLSQECNRVLSVASVIGREFVTNVLEHAADMARDRLLEILEEAVANRLIAEAPRIPGRYTFAHALIRETLYADLSVTRRIQLHGRIGETLERLHAANPEPHAAELAHHFCEAVRGGGDAEKAISYATRAGARAMLQLAYEDAAEHYERALQVMELGEPADGTRQVEFLLLLGEARRKAAEVDGAKLTFQRAAELARRLGAAECLARAALGHAGPIEDVVPGRVDQVVVDLLEESAAALGEGDSPLRAAVLARLGGELYYSPDPGRAAGLAREALESARRIDDSSTLAFALTCAHFSLWWPDNLTERLAIATETVRLAQQVGSKELEFQGRTWCVIDFLELGEITRVDADIEACARLGSALRQPFCGWYVSLFRATRAAMAGRLEEAERLAVETFALGQRGARAAFAEQVLSVQLFYVRREQGRCEELEPGVRLFAEQYHAIPGYHSGLALVYAEVGREAEARREFEWFAANDFTRLRRDAIWLTTVVLLSEVCTFLGDARRAARLYELLLPYAGRNMVIGNACACTGSIAQQLGLLASTMARWVDAERHFEAALVMNATAGATVAFMRTQLHYAGMLLARGEPGDRQKALELVNQGLDTAQRLGMKAVTDKALGLKLRAQGVEQAAVQTSIDAVATMAQRERPNLAPHAAPDGTVTILFTDIEGYTAMTERLGDLRAQEVLRAHNAIIREQVTAHGGFEVKSQGDGFMVAFSSARRAILCAIAMQRAIAGYGARHPKEPIRVRIGLHTGEVIKEAEDFFGKNVILAARIASVARGGESLVSAVLKELSESAGDIPFGEGRPVKLKGLAGVRQVFEVGWAGSAAAERQAAVAPEARNVFRCEGEYWTLGFDGKLCRVHDG